MLSGIKYQFKVSIRAIKQKYIFNKMSLLTQFILRKLLKEILKEAYTYLKERNIFES